MIIVFLTKAVVVFVVGAIIFSIIATVYFIKRSYNVGDVLQIIEKNAGEIPINNGKTILTTLNEGEQKMGVAIVEKKTEAVLFNLVFVHEIRYLDDTE